MRTREILSIKLINSFQAAMSKLLNLLIDVGNSQIKIAIWNGSSLSKRNSCTQNNFSSTISKYKTTDIKKIFFVSVVSSESNRKICRKLYKTFSLKPIQLRATRSLMGVKNGYKNPSRLGDDRWCSVVGGYIIIKKPFIVVDCGSAISIDFVNFNAKHEGGYILSGFEGYGNSFRNTHKLKNLKIKKINLSTRTSIAKDTSSALVKGYLLMVTSAIDRAYKEFATKIKYKPKLIVTGPYSKEIILQTSLKAKFEPDFVLKCLGIISREY